MEKDLITQSLDILKDFRDTQCSGVTRKAAEALGMNPDGGLLAKWLAGTRVPSMTTLAPILAKLGAKIVLPSDQDEPTPVIHRLKPYAPVEKVDGEELPTIPVLAYAGAGNPVEFFETTSVARRIPVLPEYAMPNIAAVQITGDSMEPVIKKGAYVGVIPLCGELCEGGIYLISRPPFGLVVKRVRMNAQGKIVLHSDNPKYEPLAIEPEGYEDIIIGEVVWVWQMMK